MTESEIGRLVYGVRSAYPRFYAKMGAEDFKGMMLAWSMVLGEYEFQLVAQAVKLYLSSDVTGFPPSPGQIVDKIYKITDPENATMTAMEAWSLVRKAIRNGYYGAEEEFEKLPTACQRAIGSPSNLREIAQLDIDQVETVEQSHFIKAYNTQVVRERETAKMPSDIRALVEKAVSEKRQLANPKTGEVKKITGANGKHNSGNRKRDLLYLRKARAYGPAPLSSRHTEKGR